MKRCLNPLLSAALLCLLLSACKTTAPPAHAPETDEVPTALAGRFDTSEVFSDNFTGFALYDPAQDRMLFARNEKRYFTPASNTKLFTFYAGLMILPDSLPALKYRVRGDSLIFWGTGDPSFLHRDMDDGTVYDFLKNSDKALYYSDAHYRDEGLGPGWAWGDYQYAYSAEKSPLPMYGNTVRFQMQTIARSEIRSDSSGLLIDPPAFRSYLSHTTPRGTGSGNGTAQPEATLRRVFSGNTFYYTPGRDTTSFTVRRPFHYTPQLITGLLSDTLGRPVTYVRADLPPDAHTLYSIPADSAYKYMLQPSDNFIAEQLLLQMAAVLNLPLNSQSVIDHVKTTYLSAMPDEPQWVDGSGLSRYNMFTPRSMIWLLQRIDGAFASDEELFELLAAGGRSGTIRNWYAPPDGGAPYVYAKTGTLSNNHCLSGYIITASGRKLLFSFMNNHYVTSSSVVKQEMEKVLQHIYRHY